MLDLLRDAVSRVSVPAGWIPTHPHPKQLLATLLGREPEEVKAYVIRHSRDCPKCFNLMHDLLQMIEAAAQVQETLSLAPVRVTTTKAALERARFN